MKPKMILCGNYGAGNIGDEAILRALLQEFEEYEITVMSANPEETKRKFGIKAIHKLPSGIRSTWRGYLTAKGRQEREKTLKSIQGTDIFLLGGGTLLTDEPWQAMIIWPKQAKMALKYKKELWIYKSGIGPLRSRWSQKRAKNLIQKATKVVVRDHQSNEWLKRMGLKPVNVKPDPVLTMTYLPNQNPDQNSSGSIIFSPRAWYKLSEQHLEILKNFIQWITREEKKKVLGVSFEKNNPKDFNLLRSIQSKVGEAHNFKIWNDYRDEREVIDRISKADMVIGMRLHSLIFAEIVHTPFVGIAYSEKVQSLGKELKKENQIVTIESLSLDALKEAYRAALKTS